MELATAGEAEARDESDGEVVDWQATSTNVASTPTAAWFRLPFATRCLRFRAWASVPDTPTPRGAYRFSGQFWLVIWIRLPPRR